MFARLEDPQLLICETCLDTGTRISEAVGLQLKHFDPNKGTIRIEQRHCRGDVDEPKTRNSKRTLALGSFVDRYTAWIAANGISKATDWIFFQEDDRTKPMWDSGVRKELKRKQHGRSVVISLVSACMRSGAQISRCGRRKAGALSKPARLRGTRR